MSILLFIIALALLPLALEVACLLIAIPVLFIVKFYEEIREDFKWPT